MVKEADKDLLADALGEFQKVSMEYIEIVEKDHLSGLRNALADEVHEAYQLVQRCMKEDDIPGRKELFTPAVEELKLGLANAKIALKLN